MALQLADANLTMIGEEEEHASKYQTAKFHSNDQAASVEKQTQKPKPKQQTIANEDPSTT